MTVRIPMAYSEVDSVEVERLIASREVALEQKVDGTRCLIVVTSEDGGFPFVRFLGRGGGRLCHTAATQHFAAIERALVPHFYESGEWVIDGEIMIDSGMFVAFDLPYARVGVATVVEPHMEYLARREALATVLAEVTSPVRVGGIVTDPDAKRDLLELVRTSGGEGVMAKRLDSPYEPGKRVRHSVKVKFTKTADVVVTKSTRGRNAAGRETGGFAFAVYNADGVLRPVGSCSAIGKPEVKVGDVIEVAYLYRPVGGALVQPRMRRLRPDKDPTECTFEQFPAYSKAVL
jgi:hypothetical protein